MGFPLNKNIENRVGLGTPGIIKDLQEGTDNTVDYSVPTNGGQDLINLFPITEPGAKGELESNGFEYKDLIKFKIEVVDTTNPSDTQVLAFRAFLDDLSDDYTAGYNSFKYNGRAEKFYTYNEFERKLSFNFKIAAQSRQEMKPIYQKLNYLVAQTAPEYSSQRRLRSKFNRLTIGDWCNRIPGFFTSIGLKWSKSYPWEIDLEEKKGQDDIRMNQLPQLLDVNCSFTPIHDFAPENRTDAPFILPGDRDDESGQNWL